jgi:prolyl 4-hydroxylase
MSAILYLNDVEEGGGTWFDKFDLMINPEAGKLLLFPSNFPYTHQAMPPLSGQKYILVTWFGMEINSSTFERYYGNDNR